MKLSLILLLAIAGIGFAAESGSLSGSRLNIILILTNDPDRTLFIHVGRWNPGGSTLATPAQDAAIALGNATSSASKSITPYPTISTEQNP